MHRGKHIFCCIKYLKFSDQLENNTSKMGALGEKKPQNPLWLCKCYDSAQKHLLEVCKVTITSIRGSMQGHPDVKSHLLQGRSKPTIST